MGRNRGCWSQTLGTASGCPEPLRNQALSLCLGLVPEAGEGNREEEGGLSLRPLLKLDGGRGTDHSSHPEQCTPLPLRGEGGVPWGMLRKPRLQRFCCFQPCGKICAGSHLGRIITHFHEVLDSRPSPTLLPTPSPCGPSQALTQTN